MDTWKNYMSNYGTYGLEYAEREKRLLWNQEGKREKKKVKEQVSKQICYLITHTHWWVIYHVLK